MKLEIGDWTVEVDEMFTLGKVYYKGNEIIVTGINIVLKARSLPVVTVTTLGIKSSRDES